METLDTPEKEIARLQSMKRFYVWSARKVTRESSNLAESLAFIIERANIARSIEYLIEQIEKGEGVDNDTPIH